MDEEKNLSMFAIPTDDEAFALWKSVIPQGPRELTKSSHICEYHFEKTCINWTSNVKLADGSTVEVQFKKPRLRRGSIPTKFDPSLYVEREKNSVEEEDERSVSSDSTMTSTSSYTGHICSVPSCTYAIRKNVKADGSVSFHKYPKDPALQKIWAQRCKPRESLATSIEHRHVCSLHFEDKFIRTTSNKKRCIAKNCVPTLHLPGDEVPVECAGADNELDPLAQPQFEMTEDDSTSPMKDTTADDVSDEDVLVIDETPVMEMSETAIEPPPGPSPPSDPLSPVKTGSPKRGRPFGSKSNVATARQNLSASLNSLLDPAPEKRPPETDDSISKAFEKIDFDPYSLEKFDLRDPLETACDDAVWRRLNTRARKATLRANFKRIAYLLPEEYKRSNTTEILNSAMDYLQWVGKSNSSLALMNEMLSQKHYALRTKQERLSKILLKHNAKRNKD
ncbi:THAP [Nesidiocoris tenuis]|uniref:THAP n=1 Tax=Nesidiocoris tenuis TaxID=355587 RepID=A0ABN7AMV0_9HEMI|nr:THAP [Nesidiocoris tenuis]